MKYDGYISQNSVPLFLRVIFVPGSQQASESATAGNTGDYTGDDPKVSAGAMEFRRRVFLEKRRTVDTERSVVPAAKTICSIDAPHA